MCDLFCYLLPISHKMDIDFKILHKNIFCRRTYLAIAAKKWLMFDFWQNILFNKFKNTKIVKFFFFLAFFTKWMPIWEILFYQPCLLMNTNKQIDKLKVNAEGQIRPINILRVRSRPQAETGLAPSIGVPKF